MKKLQLECREIELIGEVQNFYHIIKEVADEIEMDGYIIEARLDNPDQVNFGYFNVFSIAGNNQSSPVLIGVLTLKSIGPTRTILRRPPRSQWSQRIYEARELLIMGEIRENTATKSLYDAQFTKYMDNLQAKLRNYKLKMTWYQKIWQWIDTHRILSILGAIAAIATIVGVIIG